jgi:hypothetical protein
MKTLVSFGAGVALALVVSSAWSGCGCGSDETVAIAGGAYELVEPDPTPYLDYQLTYSEADGTVRESFTRNGVRQDTTYRVTSRDP